MSDTGLGATLQLDIAEALNRIDQVAQALTAATTSLPVTFDTSEASQVTTAIDQAVQAADTSVEPDADASAVTVAIDGAVAAADTSVTPEADASGVTTAIDDAVDAVDATVPVGADTAPAAAALDSLVAGAEAAGVTVPIDGDASGATAAIAEVADAASTEEIVLTVTADTGDAESKIGAVGDAAAEAQAPVEDLSDATTGLGTATTEASGGAASLSGGLGTLANISTATSKSAAGLGSVLGDALPKSAQGGALAVGALITTTQQFFTAAEEAQVSAARFNTTLGESAENVRQIDVGNLTGQLGDLAAKLGTSDEALQDAASRIFQLGEASGSASPQVAETTEQILALSLRARALNPDLGESGQIAEQLTGAFARGGRALVPFGIALSSAQIEARALADTGKATSAELTIFEKSAAGAALAAEQFGGSLNEAITAGAENPEIRLATIGNAFGELKEELGAPIVIPVLELLESLAPIGLTVTTIIGTLVQALVPLIQTISFLLTPVSALAQGLNDADPAVRQLIVGIPLLAAALAGALGPIGLVIGAVTGAIAVFNGLRGVLGGDTGAAKFAAEVNEASSALRDEQGILRTTTAAVANYIETTSRFNSRHQLDDLERAGISLEQVAKFARQGTEGGEKFVAVLAEAGESGKNIVDLAESFDEVQRATQQAAHNTLAFEVAQGQVSQAFLIAASASGDYVRGLEEAREAADEVAESTLNTKLVSGELTAAQFDAAVSSTTAADGAADYSAALAQVNEQAANATANQQALDAQLAALGDRLPGLGAAFQAAGDSTGWLDTSLGDLATQLQSANVTSGDFDVIAQGLGVTTDQLRAFVDTAAESLKSFVETATGTLPSVGTAFDNAAAAAEKAKEPLSAKGILKALQDSVAAVRDETNNLRTLVAAGFTDLAGLASQKGPEFVKAFADAVRAGDKETLSAFQHTLLTANVAGDDLNHLLTDTIGPQFLAHSGEIARDASAAFGADFVLTNPVTQQLSSVGDLLSGGQPRFAEQAGIFAKGGTDSFNAKWGEIPGLAANTLTATGTAIRNSAGILTGAATNVGTAARGALTDKLNEIPDATTGILNRTRDRVTAAEQAMEIAGRLIGAATGEGLGDGFTEEAKAGTEKGTLASRALLAGASVANAAAAVGAGSGVGKSFGQGIVSGINSYITPIRAAAARSVREAEEAARAEARSHSPSELFADLGRDLAFGLALGMEDGTQFVVQEAEAIVQRAAAAARQTAQVVAASVASQLEDAAQAANAAGEGDLANQIRFLSTHPFRTDVLEDAIHEANRDGLADIAHQLEAFAHAQQQAEVAPAVGPSGLDAFNADQFSVGSVNFYLDSITLHNADPETAREAGRQLVRSAAAELERTRLLTVAIRQQNGG